MSDCVARIAYAIKTNARQATPDTANSAEIPMTEISAPAPFDTSPIRERLERLRQAIFGLGPSWGVQIENVEMVHHSLNTTFRVDAKDTHGTHEKFALRVHRPGYQDESSVRSELEWLATLRNKGLPVPNAIPALSGELVTQLLVESDSNTYVCVLFKWIDGQQEQRPLSAVRLSQLGQLLGKIHSLSDSFVPPAEFRRKTWDLEGFSGNAVGASYPKALAALSVNQRNILSQTYAAVSAALVQLKAHSSELGLIHSDPFHSNVLLAGSTMFLIDFDGCGWGPYLYDLAVALVDCRLSDDYQTRCDALLSGYEDVRPNHLEHSDLLDALMAARLLVHTTWVANHLHEANVAKSAPQLFEKHFNLLQILLDSV